MLTQNCLRMADLTVDLKPLLFVRSRRGYVLLESSEFLYDPTTASWRGLLTEPRAGPYLFSVSLSLSCLMRASSSSERTPFFLVISLSSTVTWAISFEL